MLSDQINAQMNSIHSEFQSDIPEGSPIEYQRAANPDSNSKFGSTVDIIQNDLPNNHKGESADLPINPQDAIDSKPPQNDQQIKARFRLIFYFVEGWEKLLLTAAIFFSILQGAAFPLLNYLVGDLTNSFSPTKTPEEVEEAITGKFFELIYLGLAVLIVGFAASFLWAQVSLRQSHKLKVLYFRKLLEQNTEWYDHSQIDQLTSNFIDQVSSFTAVFSQKMHLMVMYYSTAIGGIVVSFVRSWLFALCFLCLTPIMVIGMYGYVKVLKRAEQTSKKSYAAAGAIAEECFNSIKTVKSLNGEEFEIKRYTALCKESESASIRSNYLAGTFWGIFIFNSLLLFTFSFLIGSRLISNQYFNHNTGDVYNVGDVFTVFFAILTGIFFFGNVGPLQKAIESAEHAVASILSIIEKPSTEISGNYVPDSLRGHILFENVSFAYPSNPSLRVLSGISFEIQPGQNIGIVGPSGSGKSTIIQLLERFYDPTEGRILLDGVDLREYDLTFLRKSIGLVSQQPVLFADSIKNNIVLGIENTKEMNDDEIWKALEESNAADFVRKFDKKLNEYVGNQGGQLSGGQKQRIAIARALIRKPAIFLLDEATSALDRVNEHEIQMTLDSIAQKQTTISVAHRLTSVINSDVILVLLNGCLVEQGLHSQLISNQESTYYRLFCLQVPDTPKLLTQDQLANLEHISNDNQLVLPENKNQLENINAQNSLKNSQNMNDNLPDESNRDLLFPSEEEPLSFKSSSFIDLIAEDSLAKKYPEKNPDRRKFITKVKLIGESWWMVLLGLLFAACHGSIMPVVGFLLGLVIERLAVLAFFNTPDVTIPAGLSKDKVMHEIDLIIGGFAILAFAGFIFSFLQYSIFGHLGEKFTFRLRTRYFRRLMYKDLDYFDQPENQPGEISSRLALDCKIINLIIGTYAGAITESLSSLIVSLIISFVFSWRITLVMLAMMPMLFISGIIESKVHSSDFKKNTMEGSDVLVETLNNMRVIRSLNAQKEMLAKLSFHAEQHSRRSLRMSWIFSLLFGFSQFAIFLIYAVIFRVGANFQVDYGLSMRDFFISLFCIIFGGYGAGMAGQFLSGIGEAQASSKKILKELNSTSLIEHDPENPETCADQIPKSRPEIVGRIEFQNISFAYSTRKEIVLNDLSFTIEPNIRSAFVGSSGCGKSTLMQLLLRFYDPQKGSILIDGINIKAIELDHLRSLFGIVRQEPTLFNGTIEHNIRYNCPGVSDLDIHEACEKANALEFIKDHPDGMKRDVGNRGEKMSGGQKQRIVIARVMVRNPKILLFDEATSALDSHSESVVQKAIESVSKEKASISIAHRISTIKDCDMIYVMEDGKVVEQGSFSQLIDRRGKFTQLAQVNFAQSIN